MRKTIAGLVSALGLLALSVPAQAASTWTFNGTTCTSGCTTDGIKMDATGVKTTTTTQSASSTFTATTLTSYTGGVGISSDSTTSPEHAIDNNGALELVLLQFTTAVSLSSINIGWPTSGYDTDIMVLAYTGTIGTNTEAAALASLTNSGVTMGTLKTTGWSLVGSYADAGNGDEAISTTVYSSWWIVAAYNSILGGTVSSNSNASSLLSDGTSASTYDYLKLYSVTGSTKVPEPGSLALAGLALGGLVFSRRRMQKKNGTQAS